MQEELQAAAGNGRREDGRTIRCSPTRPVHVGHRSRVYGTEAAFTEQKLRLGNGAPAVGR